MWEILRTKQSSVYAMLQFRNDIGEDAKKATRFCSHICIVPYLLSFFDAKNRTRVGVGHWSLLYLGRIGCH